MQWSIGVCDANVQSAHCGSVGACSQMLVYTSKEVHDVGAIAIVPNVGDAYDNALAECFLDS